MNLLAGGIDIRTKLRGRTIEYNGWIEFKCRHDEQERTKSKEERRD
jgi:hypothetical protein